MPQKNKKNFFYRHPGFTGVLVFVMIFTIVQSLTLQRYLLNVSDIEKENREELTRVTDQLQYNLDYVFSTTNTLAFIVENYGVPGEFDSIAKKLLKTNTLIDAVQLVQRGVITHNYPHEGNESVLGYNIAEDPTRNKELFHAAKSRQMYLAGPFELKQGGKGIVGRVPLAHENDSLAFAASVIRLETLIQQSGILKNSTGFEYQISKINPQTGKREYFLDTEETFPQSQVATLELPLSEWKVYVKEKNPSYFNGILQLAILGLVLSIVAGFLTWILIKRPEQLENQVNLQSQTILENQRRFQALVENSLDAVAIIAPDGSNKYVSPSVTKVLGYTVEESMKINLFDILHEEDKAFVAKEMEYVVQNPGKSILGHVSRIRHKDGSWRWIESSITNLLNDPAVQGIVDNFRDITNKKIAEDQLVKEKELSEAIIDSLPGIFYLFNKQGQYLLWNRNLERVTGYSGEEISQMTPTDFFAEEDVPYLQSRIQEVFEQGESTAETYLLTRDKEKIYYYFTGKAVNYKGEICLLGTGIDFSERKRAEDALRQSEEQMISVFNNSLEAVIMMDEGGIITNWNPKAEEIFGWSSAEALGKKMHELIMPEKHKSRHLEGMEHYRKTGKGPVMNSHLEITAVNRKKQEFDISLGVTSAVLKGEEVFIGFISDISQRKLAERIKEFEDRKREAMINSTSDLIWSVSDSFTLIAANKAFKASFRMYAKTDIKEGDTVLPGENLDGDFLVYWKNLYKRALKGEQFTVENTVPANEKQPETTMETSFNPIFVNDKIIGVACSSRDISDRIKTQKEIKEYSEKLQTAQEIINLGYWELNIEKDEIYWSDQIYKILEIEKDRYNFTEAAFLEMVHPEDRNKFNRYRGIAVADYDHQNIEYRIVLKNNRIKWIHQIGEKRTDPKTGGVYFKGVMRDITYRKESEEKIREYNEKLKTAQEIAQLGYWEHVIGEEELYWSDQIYEIWELDKENSVPTAEAFFESVVPADRNKFYLYANKAIDNLREQDIEYRIITANGKLKWIHQKGQRVDNEKTGQTTFKGTIRDITQQKNYEEAILEFNNKLQTAQEIAKLGYWEMDLKSEELTWSDQVYEIFGKSKKTFQVTYLAFYDFIHPDDFDEYIKEQKKAIKGESPLEKEHRIVLDNGNVKWVLQRGKLVYNDAGDAIAFEGTVQDISSTKLIEMELREQYSFIKTAIENLPVGIAVRNMDSGKFTLMNKMFTEIYGWSKNEFSDVDVFFEKVYPDPDYRKKVRKQIYSDLASADLKRMQWEGLQVTTKKGEKRLINAKNIPLYDQNLMISSVLDVTEKTLAEQSLALSNERYEYVTKATFDAIWDWDLTEDLMYWGEGFETIFGHNAENTSPQFWYSNIHPEDYERVKISIENALRESGRIWENEYRFKHANGTYRFVRDRGIILRNVKRKAIRMIGAIQDITSQKEYELKLLDVNRKLRNLSAHLQEAREEERISIAREIHDELGQQLTGIKLDVSWLKNKLDSKFPEDRERTVRLIDNINKTINDVRKIASHLRPGVLDDLGLEAAIEWQAHQFQTQTGIKCVLNFKDVAGNYGKEINTAIYRIYQEALTNVMRHAKATQVVTSFMEIDNTLILEVTDNGIGIGETDKNNTFSLGITGMRERALMINAEFFVKKQLEGGTKVKVSVNLNSKKA